MEAASLDTKLGTLYETTHVATATATVHREPVGCLLFLAGMLVGHRYTDGGVAAGAPLANGGVRYPEIRKNHASPLPLRLPCWTQPKGRA